MGAPVRFQKAVPRTKEKRRGEAPIGAPVRVMGWLFPPAGGTGFAARLSHRVRRSAPAPVGASPPLGFGGLRPLGTGGKLRRRPGARSPGTMEHGFAHNEHQTSSTGAWAAFWRNEPESSGSALGLSRYHVSTII